jgi:hypothetical protein
VDIILWEFAMNDIPTQSLGANVTRAQVEIRNRFIVWLDQLERVSKQRQQKEPPLVIMVYLWNCNQYEGPALSPKFGNRRKNFAFHAHQTIAESYDFVVGHVNLGKYFDSFSCQTYLPSFLEDCCHPSHFGHEMIHFLLHDFVMDDKRPERPRAIHQTQQRPTYLWECGDETPQQRLLQRLKQDSHSIASFTRSSPDNQPHLLPGMLQPLVEEESILNVGKSNTIRNDRKISQIIPCCAKGTMKFENVSRYGAARGIGLSLHPNRTGLVVFFNQENVTDHIIYNGVGGNWNDFCFAEKGVFDNWIVFDRNDSITEISMCNNQALCNGTQNYLSIMSMTVYGGTR